MPVTLIDRLPLPNLKVYTAGSVLLLSMAVYHAIGVTSDPAWRANATLQRQEVAAGEAIVPALPALDATNGTRNLTEQFVDVMTFMMQEPLCMWVSSAPVPCDVTSDESDANIYQNLFIYIFHLFVYFAVMVSSLDCI